MTYLFSFILEIFKSTQRPSKTDDNATVWWSILFVPAFGREYIKDNNRL